MALVPEPEAFYVVPEDINEITTAKEDRTQNLTQSDPMYHDSYGSRSVFDRGWYLPVFKVWTLLERY